MKSKRKTSPKKGKGSSTTKLGNAAKGTQSGKSPGQQNILSMFKRQATTQQSHCSSCDPDVQIIDDPSRTVIVDEDSNKRQSKYFQTPKQGELVTSSSKLSLKRKRAVETLSPALGKTDQTKGHKIECGDNNLNSDSKKTTKVATSTLPSHDVSDCEASSAEDKKFNEIKLSAEINETTIDNTQLASDVLNESMQNTSSEGMEANELSPNHAERTNDNEKSNDQLSPKQSQNSSSSQPASEELTNDADKESNIEKISPSTSGYSSTSQATTTSDEVEPESTDNTSDMNYRVPYYLENFLLILDSVMSDEYYCELFNGEDQLAIALFRGLSEAAQKLYVRLFGRQYRWLLRQRIQYPRIADDLTDVLQELVDADLLLDASYLTDLSDALTLLPAADLRSLAKTLRIDTAGQREPIIAAVLKHSRQGGIGSFFGSKAGNAGSKADMILKRARSLAGACYKLERPCRAVFLRVVMLFGLHRTRGEDEEDGVGQQFIFEMLLSTIGRIKYPEFTVWRDARIFKDRDMFLRFGAALQIETDLADAIANKRLEEAGQIYESVKPTAESVITDPDSLSHLASLPAHLAPYTPPAVYTRVLSHGVELLQSLKRYREAVTQLEWLLGRTAAYQGSYRGRWYDRLALNLNHHLREHGKALDVIHTALCDPCVRTGHRLSLLQRAHRICHTASSNKFLQARWADFVDDEMNGVKEAPKVTIEASRVSCGQQGPVYKFRDADTEEVTLLTRVEDVVLAHYRQHGYTEGIHGEGGTFTTLFALYFWDIIFTGGIPDTFYNRYQTYPLDWRTDGFYSQRRQEIDERLGVIRDADQDTLAAMLASAWEAHQDTLCGGLSWERFEDVTHAQGFVRCLGGRALAGILERMAKAMRNTTGGLPDLALWNPDTGACKLVEVKGPGDRLSTKQILWLDYLMSLGLDACVCHVQAVSSKKIKV